MKTLNLCIALLVLTHTAFAQKKSETKIADTARTVDTIIREGNVTSINPFYKNHYCFIANTDNLPRTILASADNKNWQAIKINGGGVLDYQIEGKQVFFRIKTKGINTPYQMTAFPGVYYKISYGQLKGSKQWQWIIDKS